MYYRLRERVGYTKSKCVCVCEYMHVLRPYSLTVPCLYMCECVCVEDECEVMINEKINRGSVSL